MKILVLAGDGIGPEITSVAMQALEQLGRRFDLDLRVETLEVGLAALLREPATRTRDLGGPLGTRAFGIALIEKIT